MRTTGGTSQVGDDGLAPVLVSLRAAVDGLQSEDLQGVDSASLLGDVAALRTLLDQCEGEFLRRVGEAHVRGAADAIGAGSTKAFLRGTLLMSPFEASRAVRTATVLRSACSATAEQLSVGAIGLSQAHVIARAVDDLPSALPPATRDEGESLLLQHAEALDPAQLGRAARHLACRLDPDGVARDEHEVVERSGITFASTMYGAGIARGDLDAESLALICGAIEPLSGPVTNAHGLPDTRTAARRRLDALKVIISHYLDCHQASGSAAVDGVGGAADLGATVARIRIAASAVAGWAGPAGDPPVTGAVADGRVTSAMPGSPTTRPGVTTGKRRPGAHLSLIVDSATLAGAPGAGGARLEWGGVVSAETARRLACDSVVTPVAVGPLGQVLDVGRRTRVVSAALWTALVVRDGQCAFPGCDAPLSRTDAHHIRHWADGGSTALANLVLLCQYHHHRVLHDDERSDRWAVHIDDDSGRPVFTPPAWTGRRGIPLPPLWRPPPDG